jgi:hypothetical protein
MIPERTRCGSNYENGARPRIVACRKRLRFIRANQRARLSMDKQWEGLANCTEEQTIDIEFGSGLHRFLPVVSRALEEAEIT